MIGIEQVGLLLLASGLSRRFGTEDKLMQPLAGRPLVQHTADVYSAIGFQDQVAVCTPDKDGPSGHLSASGFRIVENHDAIAGQSGSITLGLNALLVGEPRAVLIALADMPFIRAVHILRLIEKCDAGSKGIVASKRADGSCLPPAIFAAEHFDALLQLEGDKGARELIRSGDTVLAPDDELADFDTVADFERWATVEI